jgi:hypothetical protein
MLYVVARGRPIPDAPSSRPTRSLRPRFDDGQLPGIQFASPARRSRILGRNRLLHPVKLINLFLIVPAGTYFRIPFLASQIAAVVAPCTEGKPSVADIPAPARRVARMPTPENHNATAGRFNARVPATSASAQEPGPAPPQGAAARISFARSLPRRGRGPR